MKHAEDLASSTTGHVQRNLNAFNMEFEECKCLKIFYLLMSFNLWYEPPWELMNYALSTQACNHINAK